MKPVWQAIIPNVLSIVRMILIVPFVGFMIAPGYFPKLIALFVFSIAALTDYLDGWIARHGHYETSLGKFLDPLADKFLVLSAFFTFLVLNPQILWVVFIGIITLREVLITLFRIWAIQNQKEMETMQLGKAKTTAQITTILVIILTFIVKDYYYEVWQLNPNVTYHSLQDSLILLFEDFGYFLAYMPHLLMFITTVLTVVSGVRYVYKNRYLLKGR